MKIFRPFVPLLLVFICFCATAYGGRFRCFDNYDGVRSSIVKMPFDGGIREEISEKYKLRFANWKKELLSTDFGRKQWETYAANKNFVLTISISDKHGQGAGTDKYLWDEAGNFVGATITLGTKIDTGFPDPIYYPVMNSLSGNEEKYTISGNLLAATKLAHEIGHVNQTAKTNRETLLLQNKLMPEYISIFLKNGRNTDDKELVDLAEKMGGTPVKIWENREYWSEVTAMAYLKERIGKENYYCHVFKKIQFNIEQYAKDYEDRFEEITALPDASCRK